MMLHLLANRACGELFGGGETAALIILPLLTWHNRGATVLCRLLALCAGHQAALYSLARAFGQAQVQHALYSS